MEKLLNGYEKKVLAPYKDGRTKIDYEGVIRRFRRLYIERDLSQHSETNQKKLTGYTKMTICENCQGHRLNPKSLSSLIQGKNIAEAAKMELSELLAFIQTIEHRDAQPVIAEMSIRLHNLIEMKLDYLTLARETNTLSGGESQRIKVVQYLNNSLNNIIYIFDEPSVGLHPRDVANLNQMLIKLRDKGNTILVVEHDPDVIGVADLIVDVGPLAGSQGGEITFMGSLEELKQTDNLTGTFLNADFPLIENPRQAQAYYHIKDATVNNLKQVNVKIPQGAFTVVTGVAGSGKSSLIFGEFVKQYPEAVIIDQSPLHRSSRSNLATYTKILTDIRKLYAKKHQVAKAMFSFNATGGCEHCQGKGYVGTDLAFMEGVRSTCPVCNGSQFKSEVLQYRLGNYNIVEILQMTVAEALRFFKEPKITKKLSTLTEVGLAYLSLGQMMNTLSGGECQRIKLASELHKSGKLYVLDEPTTGLHMANIQDLLVLLQKLVSNGSTVVVIEHNVQVMKQADWLIDVGPEAGQRGGEITYAGLVKQMPPTISLTAQYLTKTF